MFTLISYQGKVATYINPENVSGFEEEEDDP